jgi:hypothetical protein
VGAYLAKTGDLHSIRWLSIDNKATYASGNVW